MSTKKPVVYLSVIGGRNIERGCKVERDVFSSQLHSVLGGRFDVLPCTPAARYDQSWYEWNPGKQACDGFVLVLLSRPIRPVCFDLREAVSSVDGRIRPASVVMFGQDHVFEADKEEDYTNVCVGVHPERSDFSRFSPGDDVTPLVCRVRNFFAQWQVGS